MTDYSSEGNEANIKVSLDEDNAGQDINGPDFNGTWLSLKHENTEAMLGAMGGGWLLRKIVSRMSPSLFIQQTADNNFEVKTKTSLHIKDERFAIGQEFELKESDTCEPYKAMASWEKTKLVIEYTPKEEGKGTPHSITREMQEDNTLLMTTKVGDVVATRIFKKDTK